MDLKVILVFVGVFCLAQSFPSPNQEDEIRELLDLLEEREAGGCVKGCLEKMKEFKEQRGVDGGNADGDKKKQSLGICKDICGEKVAKEDKKPAERDAGDLKNPSDCVKGCLEMMKEFKDKNEKQRGVDGGNADGDKKKQALGICKDICGEKVEKEDKNPAERDAGDLENPSDCVKVCLEMMKEFEDKKNEQRGVDGGKADGDKKKQALGICKKKCGEKEDKKLAERDAVECVKGCLEKMKEFKEQRGVDGGNADGDKKKQALGICKKKCGENMGKDEDKTQTRGKKDDDATKIDDDSKKAICKVICEAKKPKESQRSTDSDDNQLKDMCKCKGKEEKPVTRLLEMLLGDLY